MKEFRTEIEEMKRNPDEKFLTTRVGDKKIILKLVDLSEDTIVSISKWRNENKNWFLSGINATKASTKKWIDDILKNPERLLYIIYLGNKKIGHIGIFHFDEENNTAEIDSVLKAVKNTHPELMQKVLHVMFDLMFNSLKLSEVQLRVFSDNQKAINLYERAGMKITKTVPLKKNITSYGWIWNELELTDENRIAERYLTTMKITKETYNNLKKF